VQALRDHSGTSRPFVRQPSSDLSVTYRREVVMAHVAYPERMVITIRSSR